VATEFEVAILNLVKRSEIYLSSDNVNVLFEKPR
jgi:hypothetical protein